VGLQRQDGAHRSELTLDSTHELRVEPNVLRACEIWAAAAEGGWARRTSSIMAVGCDAGYRSFNQMFVTAPKIDRAELDEAISWYSPVSGHFRLRMRGELLAGVQETLEAAGLVRRGGIPTMTFSGALTQGAEASLRVERVRDGRALDDHTKVVAGAFDWTTGDLGRVFGPGLLQENDWAGWVGYEGDEPVAASQLVVHGGVAGLYYVGTMQDSRGKGYGETLTRTAVIEGQARGCDLASLQASPMGRPVYERIGFEVKGEFVTWVPADA